jgi:hypothetical protein
MRKAIIGIGVIVGIVIAGLLLGSWLGGKPPEPKPPHPVSDHPTTSSVPEPRPAPGPNLSGVTRTNPPRPIRSPTQDVAATRVITVPAATATNSLSTITNWEDKLDDILVSETDDTNKVAELLRMFPALPEDGQVEVAQHLANLIEDEEYGPLGQLLKNPKLAEPVLDVLLGDLLNRPNAEKLPLFLDLARIPDHPKAGEAKDLLELFLDEDYGSDWPKWQQKMQEWLKENPD